jgi:formylglycine-generating enzyme required for sulfatase activity
MVKLFSPKGVAYCMDRTEVTQAQYAAFLAAKGDDLSGQSPQCAKENYTYQPNLYPVGDPEPKKNACPENAWSPEKMPEHPAMCLDLCDARAYCLWVGKRLCGKIGGGPLPKVKEGNEPKAQLDPEVSQWYNACTQGGKTKFAYGDKADPSKCADSITSVEDFANTCHGQNPPFDQILNLSGGVAEMEDVDIDTPGLGGIVTRGTKGGVPETSYDCEGYASGSVHYAGFRCCADL